MEKTQSALTPPQLAPPGAGLPFWEALLYRWVIGPFFAGREDQAVSRQRFERLHARVRDVFLSIPERDRETRVLVPSQKGLEDSSRYWSAAMVLEHLVIVGDRMRSLIPELGQGRVPGLVPDTAKVKPVGSLSAERALADFESLRVATIPELDAATLDWNSAARLRHPWFGPLSARQWFWVFGMHAGVHLVQLKAIRKRLST